MQAIKLCKVIGRITPLVLKLATRWSLVIKIYNTAASSTGDSFNRGIYKSECIHTYANSICIYRLLFESFGIRSWPQAFPTFIDSFQRPVKGQY